LVQKVYSQQEFWQNSGPLPPEVGEKTAFAAVAQSWNATADEVVTLCTNKLESHPVFTQPLFTAEGAPIPWQVVFGGEVSPAGDRLLGRPFRASARASLRELAALIRAATLRHWQVASQSFGESLHKPRAAAHPTPGGYLLFALDFPFRREAVRPILVCRTGDDDYLFWAVEARGVDPFGDPRGRD